MKIELKHITPYLPYELIIGIQDVYCELEGVDLYEKDTIIAERTNYKLSEITPVLRRLSVLDEYIEHKGKTFIPIDTLIEFIVHIRFKEDYVRSNYKTCYDSVKGDLNSFVYAGNKEYGVLSLTENLFIMSKLFEWHFDVFRLIEDDLAIDISTI